MLQLLKIFKKLVRNNDEIEKSFFKYGNKTQLGI